MPNAPEHLKQLNEIFDLLGEIEKTMGRLEGMKKTLPGLIDKYDKDRCDFLVGTIEEALRTQKKSWCTECLGVFPETEMYNILVEKTLVPSTRDYWGCYSSRKDTVRKRVCNNCYAEELKKNGRKSYSATNQSDEKYDVSRAIKINEEPWIPLLSEMPRGFLLQQTSCFLEVLAKELGICIPPNAQEVKNSPYARPHCC